MKKKGRGSAKRIKNPQPKLFESMRTNSERSEMLGLQVISHSLLLKRKNNSIVIEVIRGNRCSSDKSLL